MKSHPDDEILLAYCGVDRLADRDPAAATAIPLAVEEHLATGCARCRLRIQEFEMVLRKLRGPRLTGPPPPWIAATLAKIPPAETAARDTVAPGLLRRIGGAIEEIRLALTLDRRTGMAIAGIRGSAPARQLLFESQPGRAGASLHLLVEPAPKSRFGLRGQLIARFAADDGTRKPDGPRRAILEVPGPGPSPEERSCRLSPGGEFRFRAIPRGRVRIRIESGGRLFLADPLDLG
jgi:hypothetical protein